MFICDKLQQSPPYSTLSVCLFWVSALLTTFTILSVKPFTMVIHLMKIQRYIKINSKLFAPCPAPHSFLIMHKRILCTIKLACMIFFYAEAWFLLSICIMDVRHSFMTGHASSVVSWRVSRHCSLQIFWFLCWNQHLIFFWKSWLRLDSITADRVSWPQQISAVHAIQLIGWCGHSRFLLCMQYHNW
jgi:hypothetical protein